MFRTAELFFPVGWLSDTDKERLYAETVTWYAGYGVTMRPVPADYAAFQQAFEAFCAERLELTAPAEQSIRIARTVGIGKVPFIPSVLIRAQRPLLRPFGTLIAVGCLPEQVRGRFEIAWSQAEQRRFDRMAAALRVLTPLIPRRLNRWGLLTTMRLIGVKTRKERYVPPS